MTGLEKLVEQFAQHVQAQTEAIWKGDSKTGNKHADQCWLVFDKLRAQGDAGRAALVVLFTHPRMDVRVSAAALLLRYRTADAKAVLEEAAKGQGLIPFEATQVLKHWKEGTWALDPPEGETSKDGATKDSAEDPVAPTQHARTRARRTQGSDRARRKGKPGD